MKKSKQWIAHLLILFLCFTAIPVYESKAQGTTSLSGVAHVQTYGNQKGKITTENGVETLTLGTRGRAKRVESVTINFVNNTGYTGTIQYQVHRQTYGWTDWVNAGTPAGTTGQGKRLEGIRIRLTGELANHYNVRYCTHIQTYGDNQGWVYNGALAGTTGEAKRLEEIKIQIVPKTLESSTPAISYRVHRQTYGWENTWTNAGGVSGTTGQAKRLEGITITVNDKQYNGGITYRTHVQSYGWMDWVSDGQMSGTQGQAKRLEAIQIKLTGELANHYDIYYRVHAQHFGWMAWVKNGAMSGTSGYAYRLEAIQIVLVKKGNSEPPTTYAGVTQTQDFGYQNKDEQKNNSSSVECTHKWEQQYKRVWVEEETREEVVAAVSEWDEPVYHSHMLCNGCNKDLNLIGNGCNEDLGLTEEDAPCCCEARRAHVLKVVVESTKIRFPNEEDSKLFDLIQQNGSGGAWLEEYCDGPFEEYIGVISWSCYCADCDLGGSFHTKYVQVGTIHHEREETIETVVIPGHYNIVPDGFVCTICGATK